MCGQQLAAVWLNLNPINGNPMALTDITTRTADAPTSDARAHVIRLLQGYGDTAVHPHVPFVADGLSGPVVMWRATCTATTCGLYVLDSPTEPPCDYLCLDREECTDEG